MQYVLVINSGSSSLKWNLYDVQQEQVLAKGLVERIGEATPFHKYTLDGQSHGVPAPEAKNHEGGLRAVVAVLEGLAGGLLPHGIRDLDGIGHRVVHGGLAFTQPVVIDGAVKEQIQACVPLAPLHNPPNLMGILACEQLLPALPQVAVFDTAFHQTMPEVAYTYALPRSFLQEHAVRRYGFHGISHQYVTEVAHRHLAGVVEPRLVTCHLGNGASITAVRGGRSQDTSMGLTPLEGLVMGTRCGDLDAGVVLHLGRALGLSFEQIDTLLNRKSGMLGLSGLSNDMRELEAAAEHGQATANLALEIYCYRIAKYIGAYAAVLDGLDAVIFTAGVGENSVLVRQRVCRKLGWFGIRLDEAANDACVGSRKAPVNVISTPDSRVQVLAIPTNEELLIARETAAAVHRWRASRA